MIVQESAIIPYEKALPRPITTSHQTYSTRKGLLFVVRDRDGMIGVGDCAPLAGFSRETMAAAKATLKTIADTISLSTPGNIPAIPNLFDSIASDKKITHARSKTPSAMFAASTALWDLALKHRGQSLSQCVNALAALTVPVNGMLDDGEPSEMRAQAAKIVAGGRTSIKIKLGVGSPERDIERVNAVAAISPEISMRLDVNGAWTDDVLRDVMPKLPLDRLEFLEQPLRPGHALTAKGICSRYGCRLALDEELATIESVEWVIDNRICDVVVLKPMIIGGIHSCSQLARRATDSGLRVIYTSSWESDIGIAATLHLAAALGPSPPAMGLSTAGMISEGIVKTPLKIENGFLKVPEGPGLGIELAPELLAQLNQT